MTAESLELKRVALARDYIHAQRATTENEPRPQEAENQTPEEALRASFDPMVRTFYDLCKIQDIDITDPKHIDREDMAREAQSFVAILNNLGFSAVAAVTAEGRPTPTQVRFGSSQLKAKLRDHYNNPDLDADDSVRAERQKKKEEFYIRGARQYEHMFPEVRLAHQLMRQLYETRIPKLRDGEIVMARLAGAAYSVRDLTIAMGMTIEEIIKLSRQRSAAAPAEETSEETQTPEAAASDGV